MPDIDKTVPDMTAQAAPWAVGDFVYLVTASGTLDRKITTANLFAQIPTAVAITAGGLTVDGATVLNEAGADVDTRVEGDTDANLIFADAGNDRVGIGTNAPAVLFHVDGAASLDGAVIINETGADVDTRVEGDTNANLLYVDAGNDRVGVGTAAPGTTFHVYAGASGGTPSADALVTFEDDTSATLQLIVPNANYCGILFGDAADNDRARILYDHPTDDMQFWVAATETMNLTAVGLSINGGLNLNELSADPADPAEGNAIIWLSDGTGTGDDGDVIIRGTAGGVTKWSTLFDHSAGT